MDEATWEEAETAMRRHTRLDANFFLTTAAGGLLASCALVTSSAVMGAIALVAAGVIAPVFEPLIRIVLAAIPRHGKAMLESLGTTLLSYATLIVISALTMLVLRSANHSFVADFLRNQTVRGVQHPGRST